MKYQLVIFDLDGTILDTLEDLKNSTNAALAAFQYPARTLEEVRQFVGNGIGLLIERAVPAGTTRQQTDKVLEFFRQHYKVHCKENTRPYEGIPELIQSLRQAGVLTAVVSNKADFAVQELCREYFPDCFDFVVGEREGIRRKPYPDSVNEVIEKLGIDKTSAVYVGDSDVDVQTAENAGTAGIFVTWGFRSREFLQQNGAEYLAETPRQLWTMLQEQ